MSKRNVVALAILVIGVLEAIALSRGINGVLLTASIAAIAGLAGYRVGNKG